MTFKTPTFLALGLMLCTPFAVAQTPPAGTESADLVRPRSARPAGKISSNVSSFYPLWKGGSEFSHAGMIGQSVTVLYQLPPKSTLGVELVSDSTANIMITPVGRGHRPAPLGGLSRRTYTIENRSSTSEVIGINIASKSIGPGVGLEYAYTLRLTRSWDPAPLHPRLAKVQVDPKAWNDYPEVTIDSLETTYDPGEALYPQEAISRRIQGDVVVEALISKEGNPIGVRVISGPQELREAAEAYAWEWCFAPPRHKWKNQPVKLKLTIPFKLDVL